MILHFSHIGLTDGLTFMIPFRRLFLRLGSGGRLGRRYRVVDYAFAHAGQRALGQDPAW